VTSTAGGKWEVARSKRSADKGGRVSSWEAGPARGRGKKKSPTTQTGHRQDLEKRKRCVPPRPESSRLKKRSRGGGKPSTERSGVSREEGTLAARPCCGKKRKEGPARKKGKTDQPKSTIKRKKRNNSRGRNFRVKVSGKKTQLQPKADNLRKEKKKSFSKPLAPQKEKIPGQGGKKE